MVTIAYIIVGTVVGLTDPNLPKDSFPSKTSCEHALAAYKTGLASHAETRKAKVYAQCVKK